MPVSRCKDLNIYSFSCPLFFFFFSLLSIFIFFLSPKALSRIDLLQNEKEELPESHDDGYLRISDNRDGEMGNVRLGWGGFLSLFGG